MSRMFRCVLRCASGSHEDILLPDGEEIIVGRCKLTKIKDPCVSRKQLSLTARYNYHTVVLKQVGLNASGLDGFSMVRNATYLVGHGSRVEILLNKYPHTIEFDPPPENNKRKSGDTAISVCAKITKTEFVMAKENKWECIDNGELHVFTSKGVVSSAKIAAYDLDGTIIKTRSGKVHPVDFNDWQILFPVVHAKLKTLCSKGFKIVFLTNQAAIGKGRLKIEDFKKKLESIVEKLSVPVQAYIATGRGMYRKPMTGMWDCLVEEKNDSQPVDMTASFYCGDAAGRIHNWAPGKKKDHSLADRLLAKNVGLKFYTPEEYFLDHPWNVAPFADPEFKPQDLVPGEFKEELVNSKQEILVMVGYPGSGKSFLARSIVEKSKGRYKSVCRDDLGSWVRCSEEAQKLLQMGNSVIVDSTNPNEESRGRWVSLARDAAVPCRCALLDVGLAHARHNNKFREILKIKHMPVADVVFHTYKKKFTPPSTNEGFEEIISVKFCPTFDSEQSKKLYYMHLLEK